MGKRTKQQTKAERIRSLMQDAGIYEPRYEIQIEITAENMQDIEDLNAAIRKNRTVSADKNTEGGTKLVAHPLYAPMQKAQELLLKQLSALGLNKLQEKKSEAKEAKRQETDGIQQFLQGRKAPFPSR